MQTAIEDTCHVTAQGLKAVAIIKNMELVKRVSVKTIDIDRIHESPQVKRKLRRAS